MISAAQYLDEESDSPSAGDRLFETATETCDHIALFPSIGHTRNDLEPGMRSFAMSRFPYLILYRILPDEVEVARILHERQDIEKAFRKRR